MELVVKIIVIGVGTGLMYFGAIICHISGDTALRYADEEGNLDKGELVEEGGRTTAHYVGLAMIFAGALLWRFA